jgi:peptidylprolyl isomerase
VLGWQLISAAACFMVVPEAEALGIQQQLKRKKIPLEEYTTMENGIQYYDVTTGSGDVAVPGQTISVHFDVLYKTLAVVSTRSARLLGGNRSVAEPFEFAVGEPVSAIGVKKINDAANGLFSGQSGVKPPPALSTAVIGMKTGGKRLVNVPAEIGYGDKGIGEIPPGATVQLLVEFLKIIK